MHQNHAARIIKPRRHRTGILAYTAPVCRPAALLSCLLALGMLSACSSVKTHVDKGAVKARTFSFLNTGARELPNYAEEGKAAHEMLQRAIMNNLAAKGVSYAPSGGDITIAYLVVVGNNGTTTSLNSYFGYTPDAEAFVDKIHTDQAVKNETRGYFEAGTLVVDVVDPATSKLLQRRSIQAQVLRNLTTEARTARVQAIVDQALNDVPLSR